MSKKKNQKQSNILSPENYIRQRSRNLPIHECWIVSDWKTQGMASIVISRKHASGNISSCMYLADTLCLGIKDTLFRYNDFLDVYEAFLEKMRESMPIEKISYDLAHNIIFAALDFAEDCGFKPHQKFTQVTQYFLEEDDEKIPLIEIACGDAEGKPMYVNTGFESKARANEILKQLKETVGEGNYHFMLPGDHDFESDDDDEYYDNTFDKDESEDDNELSKIKKIKNNLYSEDRNKLKLMFLELMKSDNKEGLNEDKISRLTAISEILIEDIIDDRVVDDYYDCLKNDFDVKAVKVYQLPNTLFQSIENEDSELLTEMFFETLAAIYEDKKAAKAISAFKNVIGDAPVIDYLNLYHMYLYGKKKYKTTLEESYRKYPDYFLIKMLWLEHKCADLHEEGAGEKFKTLLHDKSLITNYEISEFLLRYVKNCYRLYDEFNFNKLVALNDFMCDTLFINNSAYNALAINVRTLKCTEMLTFLLDEKE